MINKPEMVGQGCGITRRAVLLSLPAVAAACRLQAWRPAGPLRVRGLHQVTLAVSNLQRSVSFYQSLFGMPVQARHGSSVLLRIGDGPHFMALTEAGSAPPRIDHFGMAVEEFDVDRVVESLVGHGVSRAHDGRGLSDHRNNVRVTTRGVTPEVHMGDPNGLVTQLQDPRYCGGGGALGDDCSLLEPAPASGSLALRGLSHLTIDVADPRATNAFYQRAFGLDVQAFQASSPLLGVGPGVDFLMFINLGRRARGDSASARIDHVCLNLEDFDVERIESALQEHGITPRGISPRPSNPLRHWVSLRMPNRGGAPEGTPEVYFSDPDGLSIQLQDVSYCGGGGYLGNVCE